MARIIYKLKTKDDFIYYLRLIIEHKQKYKWRFSKYLRDAEKLCLEKIKEYDPDLTEITPQILLDIISNPLYTEQRGKMKPVPYYKYVELYERLQYVNLKTLNIIGDKTKDAVSYAEFRKAVTKYKKGLKTNEEDFLQLEDLREDIKEKINQCYKGRNYGAHLPDSTFIAQKEYRDKQLKEFKEQLGIQLDSIPKNPIAVNRYEYVEVEWLFVMYLELSKNQSTYNTIFQQMRRDYSRIVGETTKIEPVVAGVLPFDFARISKDSINMQFKKK